MAITGLLGMAFMGGAFASEVPVQCSVDGKAATGIPAAYTADAEIIPPTILRKVEIASSPNAGFECATFIYKVNEAGRVVDIQTLYNSNLNSDYAARAKTALAEWQYLPGLVDSVETDFIGYATSFFTSTADVQVAKASDEMTDHSQTQSVTLAEIEALRNTFDAPISALTAGNVAQGLSGGLVSGLGGAYGVGDVVSQAAKVFAADTRSSDFVSAMVSEAAPNNESSIANALPLAQILESSEFQSSEFQSSVPVNETYVQDELFPPLIP